MMIYKDDPRYKAAQKVLDATYEFWKLAPMKGAVQWIEDANGRLVIFTRGEYRGKVRDVIGDNLQPEEYFELEGDN